MYILVIAIALHKEQAKDELYFVLYFLDVKELCPLQKAIVSFSEGLCFVFLRNFKSENISTHIFYNKKNSIKNMQQYNAHKKIPAVISSNITPGTKDSFLIRKFNRPISM